MKNSLGTTFGLMLVLSCGGPQSQTRQPDPNTNTTSNGQTGQTGDGQTTKNHTPPPENPEQDTRQPDAQEPATTTASSEPTGETRAAQETRTEKATDEGGRHDDKPASSPPPAYASGPKSEAPTGKAKGGKKDSGAGDSLGELAGAGGGGTASGYGSSRSPAVTPRDEERSTTKPPPPPVVDYKPPPPSRPRPVEAPALKAGRHDDNKEYNRFLAFLGDNRSYVLLPVDVSERLVLRVADKDGKSLPNCAVTVAGLDGRRLLAATSFADGKTHFFPADTSPPSAKDFTVEAQCPFGQKTETKRGQLTRAGRREVELRFSGSRVLPKRVPVDVAILFDTTGSMQSQIDRLKKTLQAIHFQLANLSTQPDVRFGLVAYKDRGDEYVTQVTPFTGDLEAFQRVIDKLEADGGGDTPEDLQAALDDAFHKLEWRKDGVRLGFIITDAIPHTDYGQSFDYRAAMREGLGRGIKWVTIGAGGLGRDGEVIYRQLAQFTMGEYVFITESGVGDHEGGIGEASHHVGTNYKSENLDQAIVRIVRRELSYLTDEPRDFDDTIVAKGTGVPKEQVLKPAVDEVLRQLADYSAMRLKEGTPVAIVPVTSSDAKYKDVAGFLTDELALATSRHPSFKLVERDLQALSHELKLQLSDLADVQNTVQVGKLIGAEALVVAKLTVRGDSVELFAKLVRVETGEVLSVSKVEIGKGVIGS